MDSNDFTVDDRCQAYSGQQRRSRTILANLTPAYTRRHQCVLVGADRRSRARHACVRRSIRRQVRISQPVAIQTTGRYLDNPVQGKGLIASGVRMAAGIQAGGQPSAFRQLSSANARWVTPYLSKSRSISVPTRHADHDRERRHGAPVPTVYTTNANSPWWAASSCQSRRGEPRSRQRGLFRVPLRCQTGRRERAHRGRPAPWKSSNGHAVDGNGQQSTRAPVRYADEDAWQNARIANSKDAAAQFAASCSDDEFTAQPAAKRCRSRLP